MALPWWCQVVRVTVVISAVYLQPFGMAPVRQWGQWSGSSLAGSVAAGLGPVYTAGVVVEMLWSDDALAELCVEVL
jgi:hypothetical protein